MKNLIATIKSWNIENAKKLQKSDKNNKWHVMTTPEEFTPENVAKINPKYIFVPHWSHIIPKEIWGNYETIVFHETDLPFGRGSRPIQNLIMQGYTKTKISALKVNEGLDSGPIYLKKDLDISKGGVHEILKKSSDIIFRDMIPEIMKGIKPYEQTWKDVDCYFLYLRNKPVDTGAVFKRKIIKESADLTKGSNSIEQIYRTIRALQDDYECGDPRAYIPVNGGRIEFYDPQIINNTIHVKTEYIKDKNDKTK